MREMNDEEYCNWSFDECLVPNRKWLVRRDCGGEIELSRGDSRNYKAYKSSFQPRLQFTLPLDSSKRSKCRNYINGVNPYDDGET